MNSRIQRRQTLCSTARFRVDQVEYLLENGRLASRAVIEHPGAVVIVPILDDGRICLIKNYRVAVDQQLVELPAGTLESGEPPEQTAARELIEETGYRAEVLTPLLALQMSPGILNERMHVFLAQRLHAGSPRREPSEEIENWLVSAEAAAELIRNNTITDSKSVAALLYYLHFHSSAGCSAPPHS